LTLIVENHGDTIELRQPIVTMQVKVGDLPKHLRDALLTMEDRRFYEHWGVDPLGLGRAVVQHVTHTGGAGGSTITQQLAKNMFLSSDRTMLRKLKEMLLAAKLEWFYGKDE